MSRISKLANLVANIPKRPPAPSVRTRGDWKGGRRALELMAGSPDGCAEAMLLADGFKRDTLATLVQTLKVEEVIARWDADHDGALSRDEIRQATGGQYEKVVEQLFQAVDRNGDGKLDPGELKGSAAGILLGQLR